MCDCDKPKTSSGARVRTRAHGPRAARDPNGLYDLSEGALYHLEWDAHDEGGSGMHRYLGRYPRTGAWMFQPITITKKTGAVKRGATLYLFPHEIVHVEPIAPRRAPKSSAVPSTPASEKRQRVKAPALRPGRALLRPARSSPNTWDVGIVGPAVAREAQFVGFRRIDDALFATWTDGRMLYAQPWGA